MSCHGESEAGDPGAKGAASGTTLPDSARNWPEECVSMLAYSASSLRRWDAMSRPRTKRDDTSVMNRCREAVMLRCGEKTASAQARDLSGVPCKHQARRIENQHRYLFAALGAELTHVVIANCPTQLQCNNKQTTRHRRVPAGETTECAPGQLRRCATWLLTQHVSTRRNAALQRRTYRAKQPRALGPCLLPVIQWHRPWRGGMPHTRRGPS